MQNKSKYNWDGIKYACTCLVPNLPTEKLKGNGHARRVRLSNIVSGSAPGKLDALIPRTHKARVCIRRAGNHSSHVTFVSVATAELLKEFAE